MYHIQFLIAIAYLNQFIATIKNLKNGTAINHNSFFVYVKFYLAYVGSRHYQLLPDNVVKGEGTHPTSHMSGKRGKSSDVWWKLPNGSSFA